MAGFLVVWESVKNVKVETQFVITAGLGLLVELSAPLKLMFEFRLSSGLGLVSGFSVHVPLNVQCILY